MKEQEKILQFICKNCGKQFEKTKRSIQKNSGNIPKFCCGKCAYEYKHKTKTIIIKCANCGVEKEIPLSAYNKSKTKNFFCSQSCAAKYNNKKYPKRKSTSDGNVCPECNGYKYYRSKLCKSCSDKQKRDISREQTLGYYIENKKYLSTKCSQIRRDAKRVLEESNMEKVCAYCHNHEFDDILEVHHKKSILSFSMDSKMKDINALDNLIWLCPNHHAMIEKGLIQL